MPMVNRRLSELVDFDALNLDPSSDRHSELLHNVTELLGLVSDQCSVALLDSYDSVLVRLAALANPATRSEVARSLAGLRRAPGGIVRTLSLDEVEIAQPLLIRSNVLSDDDLIAISEIRGNRHRRAIAMRPDLSEAVTSVIAEQGNDSVRRTLAGNATARFARDGYERLIGQAAEDREMQSLLAERLNLPDWAKDELIKVAGDDVREKADRIQAKREARRVSRAAAAGEWTLRVEAMFGGYDFGAAEDLMREKADQTPPTFASVAEMAEQNQFAEAAVAIAQISGFSLHEVLGWFANRDTETVMMVLKANGASETESRSIIKVGPWRYFVTSEERAAALEQFRRLDHDTARAIVERRREGRKAA